MDRGFQQRDRKDSQNLKIDRFCRLPNTSAECISDTEKCPDSGILLNFDDDDNSQGYGQFKEAFRALKNDIHQQCISDNGFRSSNAGVVEIGHSLYVYDIRYQQSFRASQPIKLEFSFVGVVLNNIKGNVSTLKLN